MTKRHSHPKHTAEDRWPGDPDREEQPPESRMTGARLFPGFILAASAAVLAGAFLFQYGGGLVPCALCIYQRYPYGVTIALSALALFLADGPARRALLLLCGLAFLAGAGIAAFHVGVEQHWWQGTAASTGWVSMCINPKTLVPCDRVAWSLFGISLAGYNLLISLALAAVSLRAARRPRVLSG